MSFIKLFIRELGLVSAFVVLGALLLVSAWLTTNIQKNFFGEFEQDVVSIIFEQEDLARLEAWMSETPEVLRYEARGPLENREELQRLYPELRSILSEMEEAVFPASATIISDNASSLMTKLEARPELVSAQLLHQPPIALRQFVQFMTLTFGLLWVFMLVLFLYFQLERIAFRRSHEWSLMKMLGAEPRRVLFPILGSQLARIGFASILAVGCAYFVSGAILQLFSWSWQPLSLLFSAGFIALSLLVGFSVLFVLFRLRYRQVAVG